MVHKLFLFDRGWQFWVGSFGSECQGKVSSQEVEACLLSACSLIHVLLRRVDICESIISLLIKRFCLQFI